MPDLSRRARVLLVAGVLAVSAACSHKTPEVGVHAASPTQLEIDEDLTRPTTTSTTAAPAPTTTAPPVTTTTTVAKPDYHALQGSNSTPCTFAPTASGLHAVGWEHPNQAMHFWLYEAGGQDPITSGGSMTDADGATDWAVSIPSTYEGKDLEVIAQFPGAPVAVCNPYPYVFHFSKML